MLKRLILLAALVLLVLLALPALSSEETAKVLTKCKKICKTLCKIWLGLYGPKAKCARLWKRSTVSKSALKKSQSQVIANTTRAGTLRLI